MDIKAVKEIMREFQSCDLTKLEIKCDDIQIKIEKKKEVVAVPVMNQAILPVAEGTPPCSTLAAEPKLEIGSAVTSPMVGTFYVAPGPDAEPFVSIGQKVKKGDVVCIVEAMKLMNEVEAEMDGTITEILVEDGKMVEFGQSLFMINPGQ